MGRRTRLISTCIGFPFNLSPIRVQYSDLDVHYPCTQFTDVALIVQPLNGDRRGQNTFFQMDEGTGETCDAINSSETQLSIY